MRVCQFNFNNEVDTFEVHVEDDGRVTVPGEDGQILAEYANVEQLAQIYAQARDVKPENLKNWVLLENGDVYSFVLRAGTAGVDICDVEEELEAAFDSLGDRHHALSVARAKAQIMADVSVDLVSALVNCTETEVARDIYDAMASVINGAAATEEEIAEEPEDARTELEKYLDEMSEIPGVIAFFAGLVELPANAAKEEVVAALAASYALSNVGSLRAIYHNAVSDAIQNGIGVETTEDALTVITQTPAGVKDDEMKNRMTVTARLAGRNSVNIKVDVVGATHMRHTAELVDLDELAGLDLYVRNNVPFLVRFSDTVDAELEAEQVENDVNDDDYDDEEDYDDEF